MVHIAQLTTDSTSKSGNKYEDLLKLSGFYTYHQVQHSQNLYGARFALRVLYGSQNKELCFICQ
jgi:hypothetical protein